ncbi:transglutaminaseTgpA domain-containing protein [Kineococcus gynurae]|uniref:TransglutaminaseTgpA domain-containing protein n=1 Tax=Kineococcus gynurae TaxID=452979 RepID=A0ABV5LU92_9ACTN
MTRSAWTALWGAAAVAAAVLGLRPLLLGGGWVLPALGVVAAVVGTGLLARAALARSSRSTLLPVLGLQVLVLVVALVAVFGGSTAVLGLLPGPGTPERFVRLGTEGVAALQRYSVPALDITGLRLLVVSGAGLCALLVDLVAVPLRRPALAGLPLAAVVAVPVALAPGGASALAFLGVALPYVVLLTRPRAGQSPRSARAPRIRAAATTATAAGAGLVLLAAVVVPAAAPGLDERQLRVELGGGDTITVINPILNLKASLGARSDATILTYSTDEANPEPLRIVTADVFDGETWAPATGGAIPRDQRVQDGLPPAPGLSEAVRAQAETRETRIAVRGLDQTYLPLPYPSERVQIEGDWLWEDDTLNVVGDGETTRGVRYTATHLEIRPDEDELRSAGPAPDPIRERYTALPELPAVVGDTAREITADATDPYEQAVELQRFFRSSGGFTYSTDAPNDGGTSAVVDFLRDRSGFCVQFASAMAVMARSLGIPARVAIGFLPGEETGEADGRSTWRISAQDAHAWPELWFSGVGWVRFEPTPATRTGQSPSWTLPRTPVAPLPSAPGAVPTQAPSAGTTPTASAAPTTTAAAVPAQARPAEGWRALPWGWIALGVLVLAALLLPLVSARLLHRRRWAPGRAAEARAGRPRPAETAWADLRDRSEDLGFDWAGSATPRTIEAQLLSAMGSGADGAVREDLAALRRAVEMSRFAPAWAGTDGGPGGAGPDGDGPGGPGGAVKTRPAVVATPGRREVDRVVAALAAAVPASRRRRARLFPRSGIRALLDWWDRDRT